MAIPNPNPNIADGIKSDNKTYSSNKIEALISTATELPIPEAGDEGKVLTVNADHDGYELDAPVDPSVLIDDSAAADTTTYSSDKIDSLLTPVSIEVTNTESESMSIVENNSYSIGKLVVISLRINVTTGIAGGRTIITGLPKSVSTLSSGTGFSSLSSNRKDNGFSLSVGSSDDTGIISHDALTTTTYCIGGCYIKA